jgi:hypothetical protein
LPYRIHLQNQKPVPGTHIITETEPLLTVETREEAMKALRSLVEQGIKNVYAVGHESGSEIHLELPDAQKGQA